MRLSIFVENDTPLLSAMIGIRNTIYLYMCTDSDARHEQLHALLSEIHVSLSAQYTKPVVIQYFVRFLLCVYNFIIMSKHFVIIREDQ